MSIYYEVEKTSHKVMSKKTTGAGIRVKCESQTQTGRDFTWIGFRNCTSKAMVCLFVNCSMQVNCPIIHYAKIYCYITGF